MRIKTKIPISLRFIKNILGIKIFDFDENIIINAISTDSRELEKGDLFIPLRGENFDAENFVSDAVKIGAYALSEKKCGLNILKTNNTSLALLGIAKEYKKLINLKYTVAITGSVGKTTTKNLLIDLLSAKFNVSGTDFNYNNEVGVPLTILNADANTEILVIETGMNHPGELSVLSKTIEPDIAVITKIGTAHIGNFGSCEKIAKAKLEILDGMKKNFAIIPYGEKLLYEISNKKTVSVSDKNADVFFSNLELTPIGIKFNVNFDGKIIKNLTSSITGAHIPDCLLFALSVCNEVGMTCEEIKQSLLMLNDRFSLKPENIGNINILDDSYNSSPESVNYGFKTLKLYNNTQISAVLGDMLELGEQTEFLHRKIGKTAALSGIKSLYLFGKYSDYVKAGACEYGMNEKAIFINKDIDSPDITAKQIILNSSIGETILIKGSRKIKTERIKNELKKFYMKKEE